jgi:hypothetical protein
MQTYNQIITALSGIASAHKQIKQFGAGDEWELVLNSKTYMEYQYPILWVVDQPATVDGTVVTTNFRLIVADRVLKGESNERDVKSDTFQIALDVMAQLYDITQGQGYVWQLVRNTQLQPFTEKYDDILSGWAFDIQLQQSYNWSSCSVPSGTPTGYSPEYVTIFDTDGVTVLARIEPRGSYTVQGGGGSPATWTLENTDGTTLNTGSITCGDSAVIVAPDAVVTVNGDDSFPAIPSGGAQNIGVENTNGAPVGSFDGNTNSWVIADSTVNVRKTGGGLISAVSVVAEGSDDYEVADSTVTVNNAAFDTVKATESINIQVRKSTGNDLIGSKQGQFWRVGDSTVNIQKSNGGAIASVSVKATETEAYQVADSPVTVNAAAFANVKATESQEVPVQYPDNTATGTISSGVVRINNNRFNIASAWKTGQTTSYAANDDGARQEGAGVDFFTLSQNNPFGNTNRFTDTLGGQTYANNIVVDWAGADYVAKTVPMWYRVVLGGGGGVNWATAIGGQPFTFSGYNDWYIPNVGQGAEICNHGLTVATNYAPFNISVLAGSALWTSTVNQANTTNAKIIANGGIGNITRTSSANYIVRRTATFAELGITNY